MAKVKLYFLMNIHFRIGGLALLAGAAAISFGFSNGNIVVLTLGDGSSSLTSTGAAVRLVEVNAATGALTGSAKDLTYNAISGTGLVLTGNTTAEAGFNFGGVKGAITGYPAAVGTGSLTSLSTRRVVEVDLSTSSGVSRSQDLQISAGNVRDALLTGGDGFAISTSNAGIQTGTFGSDVTVASSVETNTRFLSMVEGLPSYSTAQAGNYLLRAINNGPFWTDVSVEQIVPADFVVSADGLTLYLTSDSALTGGVWRFNRGALGEFFDPALGQRILTSQMRHIALKEEAGVHTIFTTHRSSGNSTLYALSNARVAPVSSAPTWTINSTTGFVFLGVGSISGLTVRNLEGSVNLSDWTAGHAGEVVTISLSQGNTVVYSAETTLTPDRTYTLALPASVAAGSYTVKVRGRIWLQRANANVAISASGATGVDFFLPTGDVDESGEVDAADIDAVIAAFGASPIPNDPNYNSDVDGSSEVDAADIDLVIANFGAADE